MFFIKSALFFITIAVAQTPQTSGVTEILKKYEAEIKAGKTLPERNVALVRLESALEELETKLEPGGDDPNIDVIKFNVALMPLFKADFQKDKTSCLEEGVKKEIIRLYHGDGQKLPEHAGTALRFLSLVCKNPKLARAPAQ